MTIQQLFRAAAREAETKLLSEQAVKVINRLDATETIQLQHELAEHFCAWFRSIADGVSRPRNLIHRAFRAAHGELSNGSRKKEH